MWEIAFGAVSGLVLFLYGIEHFSTEIQTVAGERFRRWIGRLTRTPLRGAVLGAVATAVVQSSSATTVIAVGLVNAGTISFRSSLGVIFGANVGTTVTAQLVALKLTAFAPVFIVLGFAVSLFGRRLRFLGRPIFYFGLVFLALSLVSDAITPLRTDPRVPEFLARHGNLALAVAAGFVLTVIVQSSSVTTGIVVLLADAGALSLEQAIPILLGANLGTTTTSLLAASRMSLHARRAAVAHLVFNASGLLIFLPIVTPFAQLVASLGGGKAQQVANAHLLFNGVAAVVSLLAVSPLQTLVERLVRGDEEEILFETRHLDGALPPDAPEAFQLIEDELRHLFDVTMRLYESALAQVYRPSPHLLRVVEKLESLNDYLDERIEESLVELSQRPLAAADAGRVVMLVRVSNQLEQLGDTGAELAELAESREETGNGLPAATVADLEEAGAVLRETFVMVRNGFPNISETASVEIRRNQRKLRVLLNHKYAAHVKRIALESHYPGAAVVDALSKLESASNMLREIRKQIESPTIVQES